MQDKNTTGMDKIARQEDYWLEKLSGDLEKSIFPYDYKSTVLAERVVESIAFRLPEDTFSKLTEFCKDSDFELYKVLVSAIFALLNKYTHTGNKDAVVGTPVLKQEGDTEPLNTVVAIRTQTESGMTVKELFRLMGRTIDEAYENKDYPLDVLLLDRMQMLVAAEDFPLFDIAVLLENIHDKSYLHYPVNLIFSFSRTDEYIEGVVDYNAALYKKSTIKRINGHIINLLQDALPNIDTTISDINILSEEEKKQLLIEFNDTVTDYPKEKPIHQLFEEQAERTPDNIALIFLDKQVTYRELKAKSNQLAALFRDKGVGPDSIVAIMVERCIEMMVGIFAIIKAGGAYVPIEPHFPENRIYYILNDSQTKLLLTQEQYLGTIEFDGEVVNLEDPALYDPAVGIPDCINSPDDIAYIIYTSGSTGKPKGVMLEHQGVINRLKWMQNFYPIGPSDVILQKTTFVFDVSVWELFWWSWEGAAQCLLIPGGEKDPAAIIDAIEKNNISTMHFVPSMLNIFLAHIDGHDDALFKGTSFKQVFASGEALTLIQAEKFNALVHKRTKAVLINLYGPTEATVDVSYFNCPTDIKPDRIPIGKTIENTKLLVVNNKLALQPVGATGELMITGDQLARGYLNRPELTAKTFVDNPFEEPEGWGPMYEKLYHTGDLARWLPDGNIEYLGRIDFQVKIRGFRIETGEIENKLMMQEDVKEAVVIPRVDRGGENYLCAYLVSEKKLDMTAVSNTLSKDVPDYMVPSYFVQMDEIPLSQSGKVNRKALPEPQITEVGADYVAPQNEIEEKLADIWAEVLHTEKQYISIDDNFFKIGGHSLKAAIMITMIHKALNVRVLMHEVFEKPSIRKLAKLIKGAEESKYTSIKPADPGKEYYPQTPAQKRLFFMDQMEKNSILYNIPMIDIPHRDDIIEKERLEEAIGKLIRRQESLRTSFHMVDGEAVQKIHDYGGGGPRFSAEFYERSTKDGLYYSQQPGEKGRTFENIVDNFVRPFDLGKPPLLRAGLVNIAGPIQVLMLDIHHIISDGVSDVLLVGKIWKFYDGVELPPMRVQYKDFAEWVNSDERKEEVKKQEPFWLKEFEGEIPLLNLPTDFPRPASMTFEGDTLRFEIGRKEMRRLKTLVQEMGETLFMVLFAAYNVMMAKLSGQEEIVVGTVTAGRNHADLQNIIGMFVDTLAVRTYPIAEKTFRGFLKEVKEKTIKVFENQDYPFEELVKKVASRVDNSRNPLFDVIFNLENESDQTEYLLEALNLHKEIPYSFKVEKAKFDLTLFCVESSEGLHFNFEYKTALFKEDTIERFATYFKQIITSVCSNIDQQISEIEIIPEAEKNIILYAYNSTRSPYPKDKTINELFEEQTAKKPGAIAVVGRRFAAFQMDESEPLTYSQLNEKANQTARALRARGMNPEDLAAIMVEPSMEMIIGLLGILKAGGAFLPIKDGTPTDRTKYILEESGTRFLLTRQELLEEITFGGEIIHLDDANLYSGETGNPEHINTPGDMAYVIYTSGSTGKPKGVMIEHRALANLCYWHNNLYLVTANDHATKYAGFGFDASVWEIFPYVLVGAAIYIVPEEIKLDIEALNHYFNENRISISFLPTQVCEQFMAIDNKSMRVLLTGGDKLKSFVQKSYHLFNNYGPTENTVVATYFNVNEMSVNIPIGKPVFNNQIYIVDKNDHLQPIGVPGELCIGGDSLARGYLNNLPLTDEKFVRNPYPPPIPGIEAPMLYRTGDLARWLPDGNIEFWGRSDYQVKIRGFRIELGEIENQLLHHGDVKEAVVIAREDSPGAQKYLCAYIVPERKLDIESVKEVLSKNLPDYMVPAFFVELETIPLTPNGKIDTRALPAPEVTGAADYVAPTNEIEELLVEAWSEVLGMDKIGIDDNYFELGGDSIKTILISTKLLKRQLSVNVNEFFLKPTIRKLATAVKKMERTIEQGTVTGNVELTPIQKWFFENHLPYGSHFNQSVLLYRKEGFDETCIVKSFTEIVSHHDALRMVYKIEGDAVGQENRRTEEKSFDLEVLQLTAKDKKTAAEEIKTGAARIQRSIDWRNGPLVKLGLFRGTKGDHLLIVIHHAVVDGVSWRILVEDFEVGYLQVEKGEEIKFQDKTDSFQYWSQKLTEYAAGKTLLKELPTWKEIEETDVKPLPADYEIEEKERTFEHNDIVPMVLSEEKTAQLLTKVNWAYNTEINDILLAALGPAIKEWAGINEVMVNLEGHGRENIMEDVNIGRTVGWFTTQYPVILDMNKAEDISYSIKNVKETLRRIPNKGIGHGILKYLTPDDKKKDVTFRHIPDIVFNYLGQFSDGTYDVIDRMSEISDPCTGDSISPDYKDNYKIDIEGVTADGKLKLDFFYHKNEYKRETIEKLAEMLKINLERVIDHCVTKEARELTPSDVGYNKISIDILKKMENSVRDRLGKEMEIQAIYPLTAMQEEMFFSTMANKESYFVQNVLSIPAETDTALLEKSLNTIIEWYDILRTVYTGDTGGGAPIPLQIVLKERRLEVPVKDISHIGADDKQHHVREMKEKDKSRGFDLEIDLPIRAIRIKTGEALDKLIWSFHHIAVDGWCHEIIMADLIRVYDLLKEDKSLTFEPAHPYRNYIDWLEQQDFEEGLNHQQQYLAGYSHPAALSTLGKTVGKGEYQLEEYYFTIDETLTEELTSLAARNHATLNTLFQALWGILLQCYTRRDDVLFGAIVSGRSSDVEGIDTIVGLFINIVPVRITTKQITTFPDLLKETQQQSAQSKMYEHLPLAEILFRASLKKDAIDTLIFFENYPVEEEDTRKIFSGKGKGGLEVEWVENHEHIDYSLNFYVIPGKTTEGRFSYNALVYDNEFVEKAASDFQKIAKQVIDHPDINLKDI